VQEILIKPLLKVFVLAAVALSLGLASVPSFGETPKPGEKAPAFSLSTPDGHAESLSAFTKKGSVVLVVLRGYPGYQCPYCTRQVHDFIDNADKFAAAGAQVVFIYPGPSADLDVHAREFLVKQNPLPTNMHMLVDPGYKFTNLYSLRWDAPKETAYPSTFLIDGHGVIFYRKMSNAHGDRTSAADILSELKDTTVRR
jgi:peroxiredoxin